MSENRPAIVVSALALALCAPLPACAGSAQASEAKIACAPVEGGAGLVVKITGPLEFELDTGTRVALSEIGAPPTDKDHPGTDVTAAALERAALGRRVTLYFDGATSDRHGRALAQVWIDGADEPWLQRSLVNEGAAYVDTWPTNRACAAELLAPESEARDAARGLWANPAHQPLAAEYAKQGEGRFALVEGTVASVTRLRNPSRIYIDFGPDWHSDFTIRIEAAAARRFKTAKIDPADWKGQSVRARGYVGWRFGPEIEVTTPEQIELIAPLPPRPVEQISSDSQPEDDN